MLALSIVTFALFVVAWIVAPERGLATTEATS